MTAGASPATSHPWRAVLPVVALVGHLIATIGVPLPTSSSLLKTGPSFPCQNHPCGCLTSELCWAGDCCCFTLEEKLAWAEASGVEPPDHVRPAVEARRHTPKKPKRECCRESGDTPVPACCEHPGECDVNKPQTTTDEVKQTPDDAVGIKWALGMHEKKCHGLGHDAMFDLDPVVFPARVLMFLTPDPPAFEPLGSDPLPFVISSPPVPPPRG